MTHRRLAARILIGAGLVLVGWHAADTTWTDLRQRQWASAVTASGDIATTRVAREDTRVAIGDPLGIIEIPRVGLRAVVLEGDDDEVLRRAVGHLPDTPLPWEAGNSALAGHRDTFFRGLRHVRAGDVLRLETPAGSFAYEVAETFIVDPDALWVLDPTPDRVLTLITCYPFTYVGPAPRRFVVRARERF